MLHGGFEGRITGPSEEEVTSNTQWSIVYDDTNLTAEIALRRNWDDVIGYNLKDNTITLK